MATTVRYYAGFIDTIVVTPLATQQHALPLATLYLRLATTTTPVIYIVNKQPGGYRYASSLNTYWLFGGYTAAITVTVVGAWRRLAVCWYC